jgi:hypothetical protein
VLEPYAVKVASTVLRRERRGNPPDLSDSADYRLMNLITSLFGGAAIAQTFNQEGT